MTRNQRCNDCDLGELVWAQCWRRCFEAVHRRRASRHSNADADQGGTSLHHRHTKHQCGCLTLRVALKRRVTTIPEICILAQSSRCCKLNAYLRAFHATQRCRIAWSTSVSQCRSVFCASASQMSLLASSSHRRLNARTSWQPTSACQ